MRRRWKQLLLIVCAIPLGVLLWDRFNMIAWVGHTDLDVEFVVADAASGEPVGGARIEVHQEVGGFCSDKEERSFVLVADANGIARSLGRGCMCFGEQSVLRFTDTFRVHAPSWQFRVVANGFEPSEWMSLEASEIRQRVRRTGVGKSELVVPVALHKKPV